MGCCSNKKKANKSTKSAKGKSATAKKGGKSASNPSKGGKSAAKPLPTGKAGGGASSRNVASKKKKTSSSGSSTGKKKVHPVAKGGQVLDRQILERVPAEKRPNTKTPVSASTTSKTERSGQSSASQASSSAAPAVDAATEAAMRIARKHETHATMLAREIKQNVPAKTPEAKTPDARQRSPPKKSEEAKAPHPEPPRKKVSPAPTPREKREKRPSIEETQEFSLDSVECSQSSSTQKPSRGLRHDRSKLPMQKLTISSHVEDGVVVSQWNYTEIRELGTPPSSVADLLQGGPRQQLNLPTARYPAAAQ